MILCCLTTTIVLVPPNFNVAAFLDSCGGSSTPTDTNTTSGELADIATTAIQAGIFESLVKALEAANLVTALSDSNDVFTVFAPNDDAFAELPAGLFNCLLEPTNVDTLTDILTYHVVAGATYSRDLENGVISTLNVGETLSIAVSNVVTINNDAVVVKADVPATNGVIHVIDSGK